MCPRDLPGAQQHRRAARAVDDGRFDAHAARAAVQHQQLVAELLRHVLCRGGADAAEAVGAGRGQPAHAARGCRRQQRVRHRVRRAAQADGGVATRRRLGHAGAARQNQRQRTGPEGVDQLLREGRHAGGELGHLRRAGHVHDQRVVGRAALGGKDAAHRRVAAGVGGQTVHGLGRQADQLPGGQGGGGAGNGVGELAVKHHGRALSSVWTGCECREYVVAALVYQALADRLWGSIQNPWLRRLPCPTAPPPAARAGVPRRRPAR